MASVEEAIATFFAVRTAPTFNRKVYDTTAPQGTALDYLTFQVVDNEDRVTFTGTHDQHPVEFQIDGWYDDAKRRREGAIVVRAAGRDFRGEWGGCLVARCFKTADYGTTEPRGAGSSLPIFRHITRWSAWITDPALVAP